MKTRLVLLPVVACLALSIPACSAEKSGDEVAINGTGLVFRNGRFQMVDVSRQRTYDFVDSPALERWMADDRLFRNTEANCLVLVFDARSHGVVVRAANDALQPPQATLVQADDLSLSSVPRAEAERRARDTGIEAFHDNRVCASG